MKKYLASPHRAALRRLDHIILRSALTLILSTTAALAVADGSESAALANINDKYIAPHAYIQNPYNSLTSSGGTQIVTESQIASQNLIEQWFADGTWNVWGNTSVETNNGMQPNYQYGANIFGQTGQVAGFSFGGVMTIMNPYITPNINPANQSLAANQFLTSSRQVTPTEAFVEYQYANTFQADVGYIGITNSPWLASNYYNNMAAPGITYQGALFNIDPGGGWLITALAFNAAQSIGQTGFDGMTLYNSGFDWATGTANLIGMPSRGTVALGGNYSGWNNNYNLRLWAYQFNDYANLVYADNSIKFTPTENLSFNLAAQGGSEAGDKMNTITASGYGNVASTFFGVQGGINYNWFGLNLAYNNVFGPQNSYGGGGIISPYTYNMAVDPLYTTPYMQGLIDRGSAGTAFKVSPSFTFLNGNLSFTPSFTSLNTTAVAPSSEYDFLVSYTVPQIKGLNLFAVYAIQDMPYTLSTPNGGSYTAQFFASYLY